MSTEPRVRKRPLTDSQKDFLRKLVAAGDWLEPAGYESRSGRKLEELKLARADKQGRFRATAAGVKAAAKL